MESMEKSRVRSINSYYDISYNNINRIKCFITLTLNKDKIDRYDISECIKKVTQFLSKFKQRKQPNLDYIMARETHKDGAYHFHGLTTDIDLNNLIAKNIKDKYGNDLYSIKGYNLGFSEVVIFKNDEITRKKLIGYIGGCLTKKDDNGDYTAKNKRRYWHSRGFKKPNVEYITTNKNDDLFKDSPILYRGVNKVIYDLTSEHIEYNQIAKPSRYNTKIQYFANGDKKLIKYKFDIRRN